LSNHVSGCVICHFERDMTRYGGPVKEGTHGAGGEFFGDLEQGFAVYSKNITPAAIGNWTDGELIRAITAGVDADGAGGESRDEVQLTLARNQIRQCLPSSLSDQAVDHLLVTLRGHGNGLKPAVSGGRLCPYDEGGETLFWRDAPGLDRRERAEADDERRR
jgi:hypothetical protein